MRFTPAIATCLLASTTAARPHLYTRDLQGRDASIRITDISALGTGCPPGSIDFQIDSTGTLFELIFSGYIVQTGPNTRGGSDARKICLVRLDFTFDPNAQLSFLQTDTLGFAELPLNVRGRCSNSFAFVNGPKSADFNHNLEGGHSGDFDLAARPDLQPAAAGTGQLYMNVECLIEPTEENALLAVDVISGEVEFG